MKTWKIVTIVGVVLVATGLVTVSAFAYMGGRGFYSPNGITTGTTGQYGSYGGYTGGMMGGRGMGGMMGGYGYGYGTTTPPTSSGQYNWDCHRGNAYNYAPNTSTGSAITIDAALNISKNYAASLANKDIAVDEVEEYTQNFYVLFKEKSTGLGAFEMIIDKSTGAIYPEMGPNMMWNTKYGMMSGGMMGWITGTQTGQMTVTAEQAKTNTQQFLTANYPGTTVGSIDTFYGYYHIDVFNAGTTYGMLSVNGYTGQVWYHTWHGTFIQAVEL
jgi:hypothetical protein